MIFSGIRLVGTDTSKSFTLMLNQLQKGSPYILKNIEGLGPPELTMYTEELPGEGSVFQNRRSGTRQLILTIGFRPDYTKFQSVAELRQQLYFLLDTRGGQPMKFSLRDSRNTKDVLVTRGYVSKMENNVFSKTPELVITIDCMQPYLESPTKLSVGISDMPVGVVNNPGTAETGFTMTVPTVKAMSSFSISRTGTYAATLIFKRAVLRGDIVNLNTINGQKKAYLTRDRGNETVNLLPFITSGSDWFNLSPGDTTVAFGPENTGFGNPTFTFTTKYWGV